MKYKFVFLIFIVLLVGCTNYSWMLDSWVGASEAELVEVWGEPDTVLSLDPGKVLTYDKYWSDVSGVHNRGRMRFIIDGEGKVVRWEKSNYPDWLFGRNHSNLAR
ncbi:MAG: hypothetical protein OET90_00465 [Desulfuromonadales bacterium]|nr:hypothetical protein [Desulfuromonadales bacterium]